MSKSWAEQPYTLLPLPGQPGQPTSKDANILAIAVEMAQAHNIILRGMSSIYHQCEHVKAPADITDFTTYIRSWGDMVYHHHSTEELEAFPKWDEITRAAGAQGSVTSRNVEQHHAFELGFEELRTYAAEVQEERAVYDGKKLKALLEDFAPIFNEHLHDEVKMILDLDGYDGAALKKVMDDTAQKSISTADPNVVIPLIFGCCDKTAPGAANFHLSRFFYRI
ncbi:hypothetical protein BU23DRAFT_650968 [Bimuria novae-zelandiae CBS 107.79]|uniref:Hemerythrin-like domain-containing protein n=1 Tax=Bimuria novae-zelandiae CBS 107.79 TaxID=1447943 RepID=A0A6A5V4X4_9PLEO|nr:hypothetical protein BU23DRAFT_650968 [Bimuria novae-zelandiae CBS 107.79]